MAMIEQRIGKGAENLLLEGSYTVHEVIRYHLKADVINKGCIV
jgi:hypothetical protein